MHGPGRGRDVARGAVGRLLLLRRRLLLGHHGFLGLVVEGEEGGAALRGGLDLRRRLRLLGLDARLLRGLGLRGRHDDALRLAALARLRLEGLLLGLLLGDEGRQGYPELAARDLARGRQQSRRWRR